ncbi:P-loop containing nucleoside triphosphate hydrolase protein [Aspergillus violaceofuscus CBS 115571]|uniref:P-loop containing nucleoside triphosphate hydrolase protein n=1 Tax=Aspergillus violaceofuscus (strain CBS 115571) TaxID=1450538 RepID=A0A2V5HBT3_ASPV1|nr:P-loop containing nucleoside triphosphate hydrolase protein [Aspergillus violaceofuscus CBS 115571]
MPSFLPTSQALLPQSKKLHEAILSRYIPGYTLMSHFATHHLRLDLTKYFSHLTLAVFVYYFTKHLAAILRRIFSFLCTTTVEITPDDEGYKFYLFWMAHHKPLNKVAGYVVTTDFEDDEDGDVGVSESPADADTYDDEISDFDDWRKTIALIRTQRISFTPHPGTYLYWYKGRPVKIQRIRQKVEKVEKHHGKGATSTTTTSDTLRITTFGGGLSFHKKMSYEAQMAYRNHVSKYTVIYENVVNRNGTAGYWVPCMRRTPRAMSTVVLDEDLKSTFLEDIKEYLHPKTQQWYNSRGIPYRRGYLLHGPPGTGKTSLCFAAAGYFSLPLYQLNLTMKEMTDSSLAFIFRSLPSHCIVLMEDVDCVGVAQERAKTPRSRRVPQHQDGVPMPRHHGDSSSSREPANHVTLSGLLNAIDGVAAGEGRILIMTTNHPKKLDEALTRNGRVDLTIAYTYTKTPEIINLFKSIYSEADGGRDAAGDSAVDVYARQFADLVPSEEFSGAEIQGYLLRHKKCPQSAIRGVGKWLEETEAMRGGRRKIPTDSPTQPSASTDVRSAADAEEFS